MARQHRAMQNETPKTMTAAAFGRSSVARLPPELREAVDAAIADGATIDEIADLIRGEGGACSRSAVGRYTKNHARPDPPTAGDRPRQRDVGAGARRARRGSCRAHPRRDPADANALRHGRSQPARDAADAGRAWPPGAGSQAHRGYRQAPPRAGAARRRRQPGPRPARGRRRARHRPGRASRPRPSPLIRRGRRGEAPLSASSGPVTSAPVDPSNPSESHPLNPT